MKNNFGLMFGLPCLAAGALIAIVGGLGPLPDWLGWLLLLPGIVLVGARIRRGVLEPLAITLLVVGGIMNCQPHLAGLFRYNTAALVVAAALFTIASHLRDDGREPTGAGRSLRLAAGATIALGAIALLQPWWSVLAIPGAIALGLGLAATVVASLLTRPAPAAA